MNKITPPLKPQSKGLKVAHLHEALVLLGFNIGDAEKNNQRFGASTRAAVMQFQTTHKLPATGAVDEATANALNTALAEKGAFDPAPGEDDLPTPNPPPEDLPFSVQGEVVKPDGTPLPNRVVRAYDRALCDWRQLGDGDTVARTNDLGRYDISYDLGQLKAWGKTRADLKVEVHDPSGDVKLAESPLILQALPHETVNFSIGEQYYRGPDEYTRVETALAPLLKPHGGDLDCLEVADVLILAREADLASSNVAYYVKARRWSAEFDAPTAMFYGLMRRGEPTRIDALLARPLVRLWAKLEEAKSRNIINLPLTDELRTQLGQLQQGYLARPEHPYAKLLGTTTLTAAQSAVFTQRLTSGILTGDEFWQELATDEHVGAETAADVRAAFELQSFTDENTSLTVRLRGDLGVRAPREVAAFSVEQWRDTVLSSSVVEIPGEVLPGGTVAERRDAYARMLYRGAELRYPTPSLAGQLARDPLPGQDSLLRFFSANPEFEFRDQRVLNFLREPTQALQGSETARDDLLRIEQLFHLVPDDEDKLAKIQPMWSAGLRSAPQVAYLGRANLMRRVGPALDARTAHRIYRKAVHVTSLALNVYVRFNPGLNRLSMTALRMPQPPDTASASESLALSAITMPEWEELFGSPDACECSHCESALSPAAYLLDMLAHVGKAVDADGNNALDELLKRRPDLGTLRLTCENTETLLPHIDVVNEILEAIVASTDGKTLSGTAIGETTWDSELLDAQPEYLQTAAYDVVISSKYPFHSLPFDLWAEEGRRYLRQMGISRDDLMRTMPAKAGVTTLVIAAEALGMSRVERDVIRQPKTRPEDLAPCWGIDLAQGALGAQLGSVEALLKQAQIDYDTLLRLLNTRYINPEQLISVSFAGALCSLDGAVLVGEGGVELAQEPFREFLDRLHRFLRLQRRMNCTEYDLDILINSLGVADFDAPLFFPKLADVQALRHTLDLPLPELAAWWNDLDTYAFEDELPPQYEEVFLDQALFPDTHTGMGPDLRNAIFALRPDRADLAITTSTDPSLSPWLAESDGADVPIYTLQPDYAVYIQSATRLTADDLLLLAQELLPKDATTGHVALNLANVSLLYRMASLTRALNISVVDALRLRRITDVAPLRTASAAPSPIDTRRFKDLFGDIGAGAYSIEELAYLLLHEPAAVAVLAPTTEDTDAWLASINFSFKGILAIDDERITAELTASLTQSLGSALGVDPAAFNTLLFTPRTGLGDEVLNHVILSANAGAPDLPRPLREFGAVFVQLHKFGLAWNGLALDLIFLPFVLGRGPRLGWVDIAALPTAPRTSAHFDAWNRLVAAASLQASTFTLEQSLFGLLEDAAAAKAAQDEDPASFVLADFLSQVSEWTGWPLTDVTYLTGPSGFGLDLPAAMQDGKALVDLKGVFDLIRTKGVAAEQAHAWTIAELTFAETQSIKQTLSLAYQPDQWLEVLGSIQDELRALKRDALLGHLLTALGMEDSDEFYSHYLIDPDQSPLDRTSRIVLAHSAVQLFAQRILLNLEDFKFERADAEAWQWRKRYRVWEAARKVFLWPENWLEPELRDNKSVFFRELEDGLLQDEATHENAERLYLQYLYKVDGVSRLEIMGMYEDVDGIEETNTLHVFGRTKGIPHLYYYRRWENESRWIPWEKVELDIDSDHLIPAVYNGRLYLFWPNFNVTEPDQGDVIDELAGLQGEIDGLVGVIDDLVEQKRAIEKDSSLSGLVLWWTEEEVNRVIDKTKWEQVGDGELKKGLLYDWLFLDNQLTLKRGDLDALELEQQNAEALLTPRYEIELGMSWSEYIDEAWSPKRVSKDKSVFKTDLGANKYYFTGFVTTNNELRLAVHTITQEFKSDGALKTLVGHFHWDECGADLLFSSGAPNAPAGNVSLFGAHKYYHYWDLHYQTYVLLQISYVGQTMQERAILDKVLAGDANLHYAHQYGPGGKEVSPFFYADSQRTYFVQPPPKVATASADARSGWPSARLRKASSAATANRALANTHYQGTHADQIITRGAGDPSASMTSSLLSSVARILETDPDPKDIKVDIPEGIEIPTIPRHGYRFTRFYHPYACLFLRQLSRYGIEGLLNSDPALDNDSLNLYRQMTPLETFNFATTYAPNAAWVTTHPIHEIDFDHWSSYGSYNWELFFHIPMLIATRLMQNQRYADARRWFHYIFDPTATDGDGPERFWKIKPFYEEQLNGPLESLDQLLTEGNLSYEQQVEEWGRDPFQPHVIARLRISAYMQATVMRYLTCLIEEADMLFRRDTREDIDEARQLYLLAVEILGDKPDLLPPQEASSLTPDLLLRRFRIDWNGLPGFNNPLDLLTAYLSASQPGASFARSSARTASVSVMDDVLSLPDTAGLPTQPSGTSAQGGTSSVDTLLLFCLPHNEMLYGFWDTVADRLFKIRHSMNLSGQVRQLALFSPPIDPALLVRASAAGLSIESILSGLFAPRSNYHFSFMLQKALELCGEARGLGGAMLAALEKQDGEEISLLRSRHEVALLESIRALKTKNVEEAEASLAALLKSKESAEFRAEHYAGLERISAGEQTSLDKQEEAAKTQRDADAASALSSILYQVPNVTVGVGAGTQFGGVNLGGGAQAVSGGLRARSTMRSHEAGKASTMGGYTRRFEDWKFQADLARKETEQLDKQIIAAEIRKQIAEADLTNHEQQISQSQEVEDFLKLKFTNQQLYSFMVSKLASVHFQTYQMAYQLAMQAEAAFRQELGPDEQSLTFIKPDNWDSLKKGLTAGDLLQQQLRQMESAHMAANKRELEMTKQVSLFQLDPFELLKLRQVGSCDIHIPEVLYAMDFPAHYYRRIKSVRVTIPCVVGPYANVSATLTLLNSWTRRSTNLSDPPMEDTVAAPQTAIATSSANQDGGAFELSFNDPRYLPFEGAGAFSSWRLELPSALRPFDYATISDVVMHVSYTARDSESPDFKAGVNTGMVAALNDLKALASEPEPVTMSRLFSLRQEFPAAWNQLLAESSDQPRTSTLQLSKQHLPSFLDYAWDDSGVTPTPLVLTVTSLMAYLSPKGSVPISVEGVTLNQVAVNMDDLLGIPRFDLSVAGTLSDTTFDNANVVDCVLTLDGPPLPAEEWNDLYLLMKYEVDTA